MMTSLLQVPLHSPCSQQAPTSQLQPRSSISSEKATPFVGASEVQQLLLQDFYSTQISVLGLLVLVT